MNPFRPIAAITHWVDFNVLNGNPALLRLHSLLYLLVMWFAAILLYRQLVERRIAIFASLLLVFDYSVSANFEWLAARNSYMAVGIGLLTLLTYMKWRSGQGTLWLISSLLLYSLGLLTAEATIATLGYLGAYALTLDRKGKWAGCMAVLPYMLVSVIWRVTYSKAGFGAENIGLYADPGRGFYQFFEQLGMVYPCIVLSLISGIDGVITPFSFDVRNGIRVAAWVITFTCLYVIRDFLKRSPQIRFMLLGSVLAVIPHASLLTAGSRSGTFVAIGFFFVVAVWLSDLWQRRAQLRFARPFVLGVLIWYLVFPSLVGLWQSHFAKPALNSDNQDFYSSVAEPLNTKPSSLVSVNPPWGPTFFYLPFEWTFKTRTLPLSINALSPGLTKIRLMRIDERTFDISSVGQMAVNHLVDIRADTSHGHPLAHSAYAYQVLQALITSPQQRYPKGTRLSAGQMEITILDAIDDIPTNLKVVFKGQERPDDMVWQYFDWKEEKYKTMPVPAIGESLIFPGPFDT